MDVTNEDDASLGQIHRNYNRLVKDAISNKKKLEKTFIAEKNDTDNLMKIDIACHNKDIDYILSVLKSEDMLYVSRAIKHSVWLVEDQYEHIINPEYLNNELLPQMTVRAGIKLLKHIRQHLRTERRVEDFYNHETTPILKGKWLSHCSIPFIVEHIKDHVHTLSVLEYKRLCEKSVTIFVESIKKSAWNNLLQTASFLLNSHMDTYLNEFENSHRYSRPKLSPNSTELIMKQNPDRIKNNFMMYIYHVHVPTFVQYLDKKEIKDFLYKLANADGKDIENPLRKIFDYNVLKHFVKRMPKEEQFKFVSKLFLDKNLVEMKEPIKQGTEMFAVKRICDIVCPVTPSYYWYEFASFTTAFTEMKKLLHSETDTYQKYLMLELLLKCAGDNTTHLLSLLNYFYKNHQNYDIGQKKQFVNKILLCSNVIYKNEQTWNSVVAIILNMELYNAEDDYSQEYIEAVILFHVLHKKNVPEIFERKFMFNSMKRYRSQLDQDEQIHLFNYLFQFINKKIDSSNNETEEQFRKSVELHDDRLDLLNCWDKQIIDYPAVLEKIKDLIQIRQKNDWKTNLSTFYNKNKLWKRHMFEESLTLNPCQEVCVNALKHKPGLLKCYENEVETLCCNDTISLKQMLRKIRIYWPQSLADSFSKSYLDRLNVPEGHIALTRGLCTLLPKETAMDIITKYAPAQAKIDWGNTNELTLSLQRAFAKNMHIGRPQPTADAIILYAKGDFLQYALPSLHAIYYNMSSVESQQHIPKLLNAPVSLQKHGLRFAFIKLKPEELKSHLANVWKTTKNISIRAVTFVLLFDLMCKEKDDCKVVELWEILEYFMDNITFEEDKKIYDKLSEVQKVPLVVRPKFLIKSYNFLKNLLPHQKIDRGQYEHSMYRLAIYTKEVMEVICPDFVAGIIKEFIDKKFFDSETSHLDNGMVEVLTSYLLCAKDEETQTKRYEQILAPLIKRSLNQWNDTHQERYYIRDHLFQDLLKRLSHDLHEYVIENKMIIPNKMFNAIKLELDTHLSVPENYVMLTVWKLVAKLTELIAENDKKGNWDELCIQIVPSFGMFCLDILKEDVKLYFSCIYILFSKALFMCIRDVIPDMPSLGLFEVMLSDTEFIQGYLVAIKVFSDRGHYWYTDSDEVKDKKRQIRKTIRDHASVEVKMHYYCAFKQDNDEDE